MEGPRYNALMGRQRGASTSIWSTRKRLLFSVFTRGRAWVLSRTAPTLACSLERLWRQWLHHSLTLHWTKSRLIMYICSLGEVWHTVPHWTGSVHSASHRATSPCASRPTWALEGQTAWHGDTEYHFQGGWTNERTGCIILSSSIRKINCCVCVSTLGISTRLLSMSTTPTP